MLTNIIPLSSLYYAYTTLVTIKEPKNLFRLSRPLHYPACRRAREATELEQGVVDIGMPGALPFQNPVAPLRQAIKAHCTSVLHDQILPSPPTSDAPCIKVLVLADHKAADWLKCHHGGRKLRIWYRIGAQNSWAVCPTGQKSQSHFNFRLKCK